MAALCCTCVVGGTFVCTGDDECASGRCEPAGFCSFPDDGCGSGRRYSEWAGDGLADACTPQSAEGTSTALADSDADGTSGAETTTFSPDLGPPAERNPSNIVCGNGMHEVGELCDDGNVQDGDGCNHDCVPSGGILWTVVEDGPNSGDDYAHAVAVLPGGDGVITGRYGANGGDLFVKGYAADTGAPRWSKLQGTSLTEEGRALATDGALRFYVAGFNSETETMGGGENLFTRAYQLDRESDPGVAWTKTFDDVIDGDDRLAAVAIRPDRGELLVFGFIRAPDDTTTYVRAYTLDAGDSAWNVGPDLDTQVAQIADEARGGVVTSEGRVFVVGTIVDPGVGGRSDGWLAELDVATSPSGVAFGPLVRFGTPDATDVVAAIAEAPDGTLVVGGHRGQRAFFARYDRELVELELVEPDAVAISEILALAIDGTGAIVTAGYTTSEAHGRDIEVVKYGPDAVRVWRDREDGSAGDDDVARGVAIAADDTILAAGSIRQSITGSDLWLRKYAP